MPLARMGQLASAAQVQAMLDSGADLIVIHVGCGQLRQYCAIHIPGALYLDTAQLEQPPLFNKVDDGALLVLLLGLGIRHDSSVLLYGHDSLAPARAAHLMLYAGVSDVRMLDGGLAQWRAAGLACTSGPAPEPVPAQSFGRLFPACPQFMTSTAQARQDRAALVSVRTWSEFSGASSGYSYIAARGEIAGARWGRAGREGDVNSMSQYQQQDGCMLPPQAIERMWEAGAIVRSRPSVFYCGTGWRASLAFYYAWLMGWDQISVYDGGWYEWSADSANPVVIRVDQAVAA